jgi:drug/metabolite transporter (DMT)-like permease
MPEPQTPDGSAGAFARLANQPYLLLTLTALFWAGNIVIGRAIADQLPPVLLSFVRWSGAFLLMLPFAWPHMKRDAPAIRAGWTSLLALSLTGITIYHVLSYYALGKTQAINALLIQSAGPLFIALWAAILYRTRLSWAQALGIALSLCGVLTIVLRGDPATLASVDLNIGDLAFLLAILIFGLYSALKRPPIHQLSLLTVIAGGAALLLLPLLAVELAMGPRIIITAGGLASLVYIVTLPSAVAYLFFNRGVELIGPNRAAPFFHLQPVFGSALAIGFLGESFRSYHAVGYALVLAGVFVAARKQA